MKERRKKKMRIGYVYEPGTKFWIIICLQKEHRENVRIRRNREKANQCKWNISNCSMVTFVAAV